MDAKNDSDSSDKPEEWTRLRKYAMDDRTHCETKTIKQWLIAMHDYIIKPGQAEDKHLAEIIESVIESASTHDDNGSNTQFLLHVMVSACQHSWSCEVLGSRAAPAGRASVVVCVPCHPHAAAPWAHTAFITAGTYDRS